MSAHVLVAEDDEMQAEVIRRYLERDGHATTLVRDGATAINQVRLQHPDLVVLDVMMPCVDGLEVCRVLRQESDVLVMMLTARSTEDDLLRGLDIGADDYLTKPYSPREFMARVRTLLRRAGRVTVLDESPLHVGGLTIDRTRREVRVAGELVECTPAEFEILATLAAQPGMVFSRKQLLDRTSGFDRSSSQRTVDVHVSNLRKKIEHDPRKPAVLLTVFGVGYKLNDRPGRE